MEVDSRQGSAVASAVPQRKAYWFDRDEILRTKRFYWVGRRAQDIFFSLLALIVLAIPMLIVALVIWIDSPGASPIFSQNRVGRDGKVFKFYKFRSMVPNAEAKLHEVLEQNEMDGPVFKMKNDPRITRVGRFIRKTSIDELPQLINILKGDMSIVGPRPALPREVAEYGEYEMQRLYVTPGLTCYWQIQPNRNELTFDEWMDLDLKYIQDRSFWLDWKLIILTVVAVLKMYGE
ncbi:sugar transferase [Faecalibacterium sp. An192]|uniref:sugar transferase n=1 Tax=Faecalibacterium sp. An192 TaxID=1965581 RepID=UPI000B369880|nr:sugar transferase [Faecalibacterium sp. An192]OUP26230.1 multidrug MFS transporter [Faecalibacterium sp. An192]